MDDDIPIPYMTLMVKAIRVAAWTLGIYIALAFLGGSPDDLFYLAALVFVGATVVAWYCMFRAAMQEGTAGYAVGHLFLAIVLFPFFFLGVFAIPFLVRSDIQKWRAHEAA